MNETAATLVFTHLVMFAAGVGYGAGRVYLIDVAESLDDLSETMEEYDV